MGKAAGNDVRGGGLEPAGFLKHQRRVRRRVKYSEYQRFGLD